MEAWRQELRGMFVEYPGSAERILRALDTRKFNGADCTKCAYGHGAILGTNEALAMDALDAIRTRHELDDVTGLTALELFVHPLGNRVCRPLYWLTGEPSDYSRRERDECRAELRAECVAHLAESGTTPEPAPQMETEAA